MTEETFQEARILKEILIKIDGYKNDCQRVYNQAKNDNVDKQDLLICLENYSNVLHELRSINQAAFNKL